MISVITWDASFRESYHTVDFFNRQSLSKNLFEFVWVEYYASIRNELAEKILDMGNGRVVCHNGKGKWHLGQCLNAAVRECKGELLVIPDGDIVVEEDFLEEVSRIHSQYQELVLYFRRWDECKPEGSATCIDLDNLREFCTLSNPTNYGGCVTLPKKTFNRVSGYEEHQLFSEAGANGMDLYTRLKNSGSPIMWHPSHRIYHPWHKGSSPQHFDYLQKLEQQISLIKKRDLSVSYLSNSEIFD